MICTLNDKCDRLRKAYAEACSGFRCQRHLCLAQLRAFFEKAAEPHAQGLLLCPCRPEDVSCGERRRNTIAPSCALPSVVPNCLDLRSFCRADPLCRCPVRVGSMGRGMWHTCLGLASCGTAYDSPDTRSPLTLLPWRFCDLPTPHSSFFLPVAQAIHHIM